MQERFEKKIAEERREIEEARAVIRSKGHIEPDSLLFCRCGLNIKCKGLALSQTTQNDSSRSGYGSAMLFLIQIHTRMTLTRLVDKDDAIGNAAWPVLISRAHTFRGTDSFEDDSAIVGTLCFGQNDKDKSACPSNSQIVLRIDQKLAAAAAEERGDGDLSSTDSDDLALYWHGRKGRGESNSSHIDSNEESDVSCGTKCSH